MRLSGVGIGRQGRSKYAARQGRVGRHTFAATLTLPGGRAGL